MSIGPGTIVKINEETARRLVAPFSHYAYGGRTGVVTAAMKDGWQVAFDPDLPGGRPRKVVLADRDLVAVETGAA